ncbi:acetyl/propionyl-CoA carboxylase alpha subunit [Paraburkholderia silvatlantica]|uniref:Acetyl/propionyl-CoA carboxylase alpha subunit n=2 Tax=Paraburkholderia silvatlantica TaxID=321895 RepID=A0A2V4TZ80_9BURK|nr:acetyl/propionyl-CoA carboxylase alpha subunit [Paraburkholderia silvatlantica]TDQ86599.1 acetyl/propionyl-CoA carboxylase alpha subunit [Paraburkholderia silvatlantica]
MPTIFRRSKRIGFAGRNNVTTMKRILVANRGEIACRIIDAAHGLGIEAIAVYSDADAGAKHCAMADVAVAIGPSPAIKSYLDMQAVLDAGAQHGADGVHPGYGFLSENTAFARAAQARGMKWIGPSVESIENMGDKNRARNIAEACGVPVLPGSVRFAPDDLWQLESEAARVGFPLLVKASGGGGGIGMKRVDTMDTLHATVTTTQQLAAKAFGDPGVYLERFVPRARHIEIQVFGYGDGRAVHLFERECSVQRRFQKIVEESPVPHLPAAVLERMSAAAVALTASQRYSGAGTVKFVVDADTNEFFFLEMNARIQVEHGVTQAVTGWDLVQAQILLAAGSMERVEQDAIQRRGAAIECRLYAENPAKNFLSSPGKIEALTLPVGLDCMRIDTGIRAGDAILLFYDPMIAKLIASGTDRQSALTAMANALAVTRIEGIRHNVAFLSALIAHPGFVAGNVDTGFVQRESAQLLAASSAVSAGVAV